MTPTITLIENNISYAPKFKISPWKVGKYYSINGVYTTTIGPPIIGFSSSWVESPIPGITISAYGSSIQKGNNYINRVDNSNGTYSYFFKLSGTPASKGTYNVRNQLLPPQIQNGMWFDFTIVDDSYDEPKSTASHHKEIRYNNKIRVSISSAIEFVNASWSSNKKMWDFEYRVAGIGHTNNVAGIKDRISYARILIKSTQNQSKFDLWSTPNDPRFIGSTPAASTNTNYSGLANTVVSLALKANPWASSIWGSASAIVALLASFSNSNSDSTQVLERSWSWLPMIEDTCQFFWFDLLVEPNEVVEFSYEYTIVGNSFDILSVKGYRMLSAGPSKGNQIMNPELMTPNERELHGIKTISRHDLLTKTIRPNISEKTINDWLKSDRDLFYYTNNFNEEEVNEDLKNVKSEESVSIESFLSKELSEKIEESTSILEILDNAEYAEDIVKKHTDRLVSLLRIQKLLESNQKYESSELEDILNDFLKIVNPEIL